MSPSPVVLREGRPEDLPSIRAFTSESFSWGDYVPDHYLAWLEDSAGATLVATKGDRAIAVVHVQQVSATEGWLSGARVHPDHQRQGIGSMLNHAGVDWLAARGIIVVRLTSEDNNLGAQRQVEKLGYRPVARFGLAERAFDHHGRESNGGRRLRGPERFDLAPAAEAEPAYMVWAAGDLNRASHGLFASEGWSFRRLQLADLLAAAGQRTLWISPSAWAIAKAFEEELWVSLLLSTPEDGTRAVRALIDLAEEQKARWLRVMIPRIEWLEQTLATERVEMAYPNIVYEKVIV